MVALVFRSFLKKITISWKLDAAKSVNAESGTLYRLMKSFLTNCEQDKWKRDFINLPIFLLDPGLLVQLALCQTQERRQSSLSSKASVKGLRLLKKVKWCVNHISHLKCKNFRTGLDTKYVLVNDDDTGLLTYVGRWNSRQNRLSTIV